MKILVVDDSITIRTALSMILKEAGHVVDEVDNGFKAVKYFLANKVDLIMLDVEMPGMSGYDTAKKLREFEYGRGVEQAIENWTPIIFLSSRSDDQSLSKGIESGADDYLFKPFSKVVIKSKIKAMERIYHMKQSLIAQKKQIKKAELHAKEQHEIAEQVNQELLHEQTIAKSIYDNIIQYGFSIPKDIVRSYVKPKSIFNGDLFLIAKTTADSYYIMLGDFTGHGLSAALGIIPTAELFLAFASKGYTINQLLIELNRKLYEILPSHIFCAAFVLEADLNNNRLAAWNGWSPEGFCIDANGKLKQVFTSENMPLGVLKPEKFQAKPVTINFNQGDRLFLCSDGFTETTNANGEMFGIERMQQIIESHPNKATIFDEIIKQVTSYNKGSTQTDDLTLVEITNKNN